MHRSMFVIGLVISTVGVVAYAQHNHTGGTATEQNPGHMQHREQVPVAAAPVAVGKQVTCPVTGEPINPDVTTTYQGRKVSFCCRDCIEKFAKAPQKYLPSLYRQLYPQQVQVTCPVMGGEVNPQVFTEHKGQKVFFCCKGCDKKFDADPAKYESKLKESYTRQVHCPVTGNAINPTVMLEEESRTVYFFSKGAIRAYQAKPELYAGALRPEIGVVAYGPTAKEDIVRCPVCPADTANHKRAEVKTAVYQGKVYFLSSADCLDKFNADPAEYAKLLAEPVKQASSERK